MWKDRPRHDAASHAADAFRMFAVGYRPETAVVNFPDTVGLDWDPLAGVAKGA